MNYNNDVASKSPSKLLLDIIYLCACYFNDRYEDINMKTLR